MITETGNPLSPRAREKHARIMAAAQRLFLDLGFAGTSMEAIRLKAGVSKPTLYHYFKSKEDLFVAIMHALKDEMEKGWESGDHSDTPVSSAAELRARLLERLHSMSAFMRQPDYINLVRRAIAEMPAFPQLEDLFGTLVPLSEIEWVTDHLERARHQGIITQGDSHAAAHMLVGPILFELMMRGFLNSKLPRDTKPTRIEAVVDVVLNATH